jgi:hypothetical protein
MMMLFALAGEAAVAEPGDCGASFGLHEQLLLGPQFILHLIASTSAKNETTRFTITVMRTFHMESVLSQQQHSVMLFILSSLY